MRLPFLDRDRELTRLRRGLARPGGSLIAVYGRRRCGKSRLLQEALRGHEHAYYLADLSDASIQRHTLTVEAERVVPGFAAASYADWAALLDTWRRRAPEDAWLVLDELPYLVQVSPALPSVIQRIIDTPGERPLRLAACGSSQRMMHGLVMDQTAPLYGRAAEIIQVAPMPPEVLPAALHLNAEDSVVAYSVWGGLPRNWELAADYASTSEALAALVLDRNGVLHGEPSRLLTDDMRSAVQANSLLALIGGGCHRLSELAGRVGQSATSLSRPLSRLIDLGYVRREVPFGESVRSTRRSLYRLDDPFLLFWYRFVAPNRSRLEMDLIDLVHAEVLVRLAGHVADVWEWLARRSVPFTTIDGLRWNPASRWWGRGDDGRQLEIDVVAESTDRRHVLLGEAKWSDRADPTGILAGLIRKAQRIPFRHGRPVHYALWLKRHGGGHVEGASIITPDKVMPASPGA